MGNANAILFLQQSSDAYFWNDGKRIASYSTIIKDWTYYDVCKKKVLNDTSIFSVYLLEIYQFHIWSKMNNLVFIHICYILLKTICFATTCFDTFVIRVNIIHKSKSEMISRICVCCVFWSASCATECSPFFFVLFLVWSSTDMTLKLYPQRIRREC